MLRTIAILGAGFSGAMTAVQLLRSDLAGDVRVVLVERAGPAGRGLAYGVRDDSLLLNVPAGNMSAVADAPGHFLDYLRGIDPKFNAGSFVARSIYGDYLEHTLAQVARAGHARLEVVSAEAIAVRRTAHAPGFTVEFAGGGTLRADQAVLALGHFPPAGTAVFAPVSHAPSYVANPWDWAALDRIDAERPVVILGTGHTAIDALLCLTRRGGVGKAILVSRRGLLPHGHRQMPIPPAAVARPDYLPPGAGATVRDYLRAVRTESLRCTAAGGDWRDVLNALRPHTPELWRQLDAAQRRRFLRRLLPYWNVHRHRLAPAAHLRLHNLVASGQVEVRAGTVVASAPRDGWLHVSLRGRDRALSQIHAGAIVNCSGPEYDIERVPSPLLRQLLDEGLARQDAGKLGIDVDDQYHLVGRDGSAIRNLFYVGPMLRARYWEAVAVPELRLHCQQLARQMVAEAELAGRAAKSGTG
jgi:uncharacterized NAD(P)/FAD-binding protein YdhS